jgi:hypothetical protein
METAASLVLLIMACLFFICTGYLLAENTEDNRSAALTSLVLAVITMAISLMFLL